MTEPREITLQFLVKFRSGQDYKHVDDPAGSVPVYGSGGIFASASDYLYDGESVLFGRKGTIDRPAYVCGKFWTVDTMFYTELREGVSGRWLYYWATTIPFGLYSTDTALPSMTSSVLGRIKAPLVPHVQQCAIADYLDRETAEIDAMLAKLNSLSEALAERKVLVIQNLTQRSDSGVRWTAVPTAHLFSSIGSGTTPKGLHYYAESGSGIPWVTTSELRESVIVETTQDVTEEAVGALSALRVHPRGSVVIAMYGATIGRLAMLGVDAAMNQACCAFSSPRNVDSRFFYYALWGQRGELILEANGGGQPNISQGFLRRWRVPCPPLVEQRRIADHLDEVTGRIDAMVAKVAELKALLVERRAALITDVVTGRKQVPA
mgnify:CR=1 FL=1